MGLDEPSRFLISLREWSTIRFPDPNLSIQWRTLPHSRCAVIIRGLHYRCIQNPYHNPQILYKMFSPARFWVLGLPISLLSEVPMISIGMDLEAERQLVLPILSVTKSGSLARKPRRG